MEYSEAPSIQNVCRKHQFPLINWLSKAKFEEKLNQNIELYPHLNPDNDDESEIVKSRQSKNNRIYVGKSSQTHTSEGVKYETYSLTNHVPINLEIIGSVVHNDLTGVWELHVSHGTSEIVIKNDFFMLSIEDPNAIEWKRTRKGEIPPMALRGCIDRFTSEYFYIGKTCDQEKKPRYLDLANTHEWTEFAETIPARFGKVHVGHECLYVGFNNMEISFVDYDILCLRPTPAPLLNISRVFIRLLCKNSNDQISKINSDPTRNKFLPEYFVKFLKYPSQLTSGEYMIKGERLVREDGKFEILIDKKDNLICREVISENKLEKNENKEDENSKKPKENNDSFSKFPPNISNLLNRATCSLRKITPFFSKNHPRISNSDKSESDDDDEEQPAHEIIEYDADSIWLHKSHCVVYNKNGNLQILSNFYDKMPEYKFHINYSDPPSFEISELN